MHMLDSSLAYRAVVELLDQAALTYTAQVFPSGAIMLDLWHGNRFYVLQFEEAVLGLSEITEQNPGFDTVPDEKFTHARAFLNRIDLLLTAGAW